MRDDWTVPDKGKEGKLLNQKILLQDEMRYGIDPQRGHHVTSLWVNVQRAQWSMLEGSEINTPNKVQ